MHSFICVMSQMNLKCIVFYGLLLLMYYDITAMTSQQMHGCIHVMSHIFQIHRLMCDVILFLKKMNDITKVCMISFCCYICDVTNYVYKGLKNEERIVLITAKTNK